MTKRFIRFKEHIPALSYDVTLTEAHHAETDGSLLESNIAVRVDNHGFIMNGNDPESKETIVWAGDSVVECINIPEPFRLSSFLERKLHSDGIFISVKNAGYSGSTLLHTINLILNKIVPMRPKMIILSTGAIDQATCQLSKNFWSSNEYVNPLTHADGPCKFVPEAIIPFDADRWHQLFQLVSEMCKIFNIKLIVSTIPFRSKKNVWFREMVKTKHHLHYNVECYKKMNVAIRSICSNYGNVCMDFETEISGRDDLFYDHVHLNVKGADVVSDIARYYVSKLIR